VRASRLTVAGWPTLTLLMSDSLKATVIVMLLVLTISAKGEAEDEDEDELEPPRLPAVAPAPPPVVEADDDPVLEADVEALEVAPAETELPGERLASETIVPLIGA
jgi:hypothetical protein